MSFGPLHTKKLVELLATQPTLQLVTYNKIAKIIGEPYPSPSARHSFYAARDILLDEYGKLVLTARGRGYFVADKTSAMSYVATLRYRVNVINLKKRRILKIAA